MAALAAGRLTVAFLMSAYLSASQVTGPTSGADAVREPTVTALVVQVSEDEVRVISAAPSSGRPASPDVEEALPSIRAGQTAWIEYSLQPAVLGQAPIRGDFLVSMSAVVESADPDAPSGLVRLRRLMTTVAIPFVRGPATITFVRVHPMAGLPPDRWNRVSMGGAALSGARR